MSTDTETNEAVADDIEDVELSNSEMANASIQKYTMAASAAGLIPLPMVDLAAIVGIQLKMLHSLSNTYEVPFSKDVGKSAIASLVGGVAPVATAPALASLMKVIPIIGSVAGSVSSAALAAASTYAVGKVFTQHFELGGTLLDFDADKVRAYFEQEFKNSKEAAAAK